MAPGEIWVANYHRHDGLIQQRPVLVIGVSGDAVAYVQIRGSEDQFGNVRGRRYEDSDIVDWREAGLRKPSHARFENKFEAPASNLVKFIGRLSEADKKRMRHQGLGAW